jgi:hypothetical protein
MANQDKDLTHLFVRDLDDIPLPPRDKWRPTPRKESQVMKTSRYVLYAGAIATVLVIALIASFQLRGSNQVAASPSPTASATTSPAPTASATPAVDTSAPPAAGVVTGRIVYNAGFIPALTVYAINVADQARSFFVQRPRFAEGQGPDDRATYSITGVAPGTYWVVAWWDSDATATTKPGLYSQFVVRCVQPSLAGVSPLPPECSNSRTADHTLVPVTVRSGETVSRIDVGDWSYDQASYPPRPTADSGLVNVCGAFNAYMPASSGRNAVLSMDTPSGVMNFELVLNGTVPPDLQQNGAQLVRLTGRRVQGINTVADYNVVRVSSCSAP